MLSSILAILMVAFSVFRRRGNLSAAEAEQQIKDVELAQQYANLFEEQVALIGSAPVNSECGITASEVLAWKQATPRILEALPSDTREAAAFWVIAEIYGRNCLEEMARGSDHDLPS